MYALRLLTARPYTVRDLRRRLERRAYAAAEVRRTVADLERSGLLDDTRFAEQFAHAKIVNESTSPRRVQQLLTRKGIDSSVAQAAVARVLDDELVDPGANAEKLARRKLAALGDLPPKVVRQRLFGYLARRGYDYSDIRTVIGRVLG